MATDDEVLEAVGNAAGVDLSDAPRNDLQSIIYAMDHCGLTETEALVVLARTMSQRSVVDYSAEDWARVAIRLGPVLVDAIRKIASAFG